MKEKYEILIRILDEIRKEAPERYNSYTNCNTDEELQCARSKCYIHLFLKVSFGILDFEEREKYITDGPYDGGIDAYFIDEDEKKIFYIQSKFRNTPSNFENKDILYSELLNMDIARIIKDGEHLDEKGNKYNGKIQGMQRTISNLSNLPMYDTKVIILANVIQKEVSSVKRAIGGYDCDIFDYERTYNELIFPIITSTFYNKKELVIKIKVDSSNSNRAKSDIKTSYKDCTITMLLVPTEEIGRIMSMYKNSILKYNPRSFLSLQSNEVNRNIERAIKEIESNDFALFNNGVTMLASEVKYSDSTAVKGEDQLLLKNPQIINGGQTAYTLSQIYEECKKTNVFKVFDNKSVVLKVISLDVFDSEINGLRLIEQISKATNFQTPVEIQDRISNDEKQVLLQKNIYEKFGYFYERKRGEYSEGISKKYIPRDIVIDKSEFMRIFIASIGSPSKSRTISLTKLFSDSYIDKIELNQIEKYFFAYKCYECLKKLIKNNKDNWNELSFGNALRYGSYAVVYAAVVNCGNNYDIDNVETHIGNIVNRWIDFENHIQEKKDNNKYFKLVRNQEGKEYYEMNYNGYYRGTTLGNDIYSFFKI